MDRSVSGPVARSESDDRELALQILREHTVLSLATLFEGRPHCVSLIYAEEEFTLYWVSEARTRHSRALAESPRSSLTISGHPQDFSAIRGLQCSGMAYRASSPEERFHGLRILGEKYPFFRDAQSAPDAMAGALAAAEVWRFEPTTVTLIDNTHSFGYKRTFEVH